MPSPQIQDMFAQQQVQLANTIRLEGDFRFATNDFDWIGYGVNANKGVGQTTRFTFAAPGELPPGGQVYITFVRNVDGVKYPVQIELKNTTTAAINLAQALADRINGSSTVAPAPELIGYKATVTADTPATTVSISSTPGESFDVRVGNFGITQNGVVNPVAPSIVTTIAASNSAPIPFGRAIVTNLIGNSAAYNQPPGIVALEADKIVALPSGATTERFAGWSYRPVSTYIAPPYSDRDLEAYPTCEPVLYVRSESLHGQQIMLKLEQLPAGASVPGTLVGQPIYYRKAVSGGFSDLGAASILGGSDPNRALAADDVTNRQWQVIEVADPANNLVWAGLKGY